MRSQVAGVLIREGRVLLCLRSATRSYYPGVWDLPGGHVEPGEADNAALRRELAEELGIVLRDPPSPPFAHITDETLGFDLKLWIVRDWGGTPENLCPDEHESIGWFAPDQITGLPLALEAYTDLIQSAVA